MPADASIYDSDRLARCYANDRPAIHGAICARLFAAIPRDHNLERAVDIGCGAGASTAALTPYVEHATGIDPFERMLRHARHRYTKATFLQSWAEALPLGSGRFGLVTAAGSLSYMNLDAALSEGFRRCAAVPAGPVLWHCGCAAAGYRSCSRNRACAGAIPVGTRIPRTTLGTAGDRRGGPCALPSAVALNARAVSIKLSSENDGKVQFSTMPEPITSNRSGSSRPIR